MVRVHLWISGIVQGVFYRQNTKETALRLNLTGWVRNLPDGRVEAVAEGEKGDVESLTRWCQKGPAFAKVDEVHSELEKYTGEFNSFSIIH